MIAVSTYNQFSAYPVHDRIDWIDTLDLVRTAQDIGSQILKRLLRQIFENDDNSYIRKRAIECISESTLLNIISRDFTKDFLLEDVAHDTSSDSFIASTRLKYLFLLYGDDSGCYQAFQHDAELDDSEIASEACYRAGLIHLLYRVNQNETADPINELNTAKEWFLRSYNQSENRIDAYFFILTSDYISALLGSHLNAAEKLLEQLTQILWMRQVWGYKHQNDILEYRVFSCLSNLYSIAKKTTQEAKWIDHRAELLFLCDHLNEMLLTTSLPIHFVHSIKALTQNPLSISLNRYFINNLSACKLRIETLLEAPGASASFIEFLTNLKNSLNHHLEKKSPDNFITISALIHNFSYLDPTIIENDILLLKSDGYSDVEIIADLCIKYTSKYREDRVSFTTGYVVGDEMLSNILSKLKHLIPNYPSHKLSIFSSVLSDLIRYLYQSETLPKEFFKLLYAPSPTQEKLFHQHLYEKLTSGNRAAYFHYEESDIIGGGRLDITYSENGLIFPIEVKKSEIPLDWEGVKADYAAQAQTYSRPYHQLGFLVIYDLTPKKNEKPLNDIRSLVNIVNLDTLHSLNDQFLDYVVVIIIPANKVRPSDYTKYH